MAAYFPDVLVRLIAEHYGGSDVDPVSVIEGQALNACALVYDAVDAVGILDDPGVVLIANACVQTRDTLVGNTHIVALQSANSDQRFVEPTLANDFVIVFDGDASLFHRALRCLRLW